MKYNYEKILTVGFKDIERQIYDAVCRAARQITKDLLEQLDKHLMNTRDKKRYANKQIRRATVKTVYGEVEYNRHMYYDKTDNRYLYLLEDNLQMEKIGTVSANLAQVIAEAAVDAPAVVRHTERIDLALAELVQIRIFQLYVVQICPVRLVDHRPGVVVVRARFMPRDDVGLIAEPPRAVHERRGEAIAVALALLQKGFCRFLCPVGRAGVVMRHGKILEIVADVVKHGLQPRRAVRAGVRGAVLKQLPDALAQLRASAGIAAVCAEGE